MEKQEVAIKEEKFQPYFQFTLPRVAFQKFGSKVETFLSLIEMTTLMWYFWK